MKLLIQCDRCGIEFERERAYVNRSSKLGQHQYCSRSCNSKVKADKLNERRWAQHIVDTPTMNRKARLKYRYNITLERYDQLVKQQADKCAICGCGPAGKRWSIDHDHSCCPGRRSCGQCVRGLLCSKCNRALGFLENQEFVTQAQVYLGAYQK